MQIHPLLKDCRLTFRAAASSIDLDIVPSDQDGRNFQVHHRWLDYEYVHNQRPTCPLFQSKRANQLQQDPPSRVSEEGTCDCAVERILDILLSELRELSVVKKRKIAQTAQDLLKTMPRNVVLKGREDGEGVEINFQIATDSYFGDFEILVCSETVQEERLYYLAEEDGGEDEPVPAKVDSSAGGVTPDPDSEISPASPADPTSPRNESTDILYRGNTNCATSYTLNISQTPLISGTKYTLILRPYQSQGFYSPSYPLTTPVPVPTNLLCTRASASLETAASLTVTWTSPLPSTGKFRVACVDNADWKHVSPWIGERQYMVTCRKEILEGEIWVGVVAESALGVKSVEAKIVLPPEMEGTTSPEEALEEVVVKKEPEASKEEMEEDSSVRGNSSMDDGGSEGDPDDSECTNNGSDYHTSDDESMNDYESDNDGEDEVFYTGCAPLNPAQFVSPSPARSRPAPDDNEEVLKWERKPVSPCENR